MRMLLAKIMWSKTFR